MMDAKFDNRMGYDKFDNKYIYQIKKIYLFSLEVEHHSNACYLQKNKRTNFKRKIIRLIDLDMKCYIFELLYNTLDIKMDNNYNEEEQYKTQTDNDWRLFLKKLKRLKLKNIKSAKVLLKLTKIGLLSQR